MKIAFDVLEFFFEKPTWQFYKIPTKDIWSFEESYPILKFYFPGDSNPPLTFSYFDITLYQGHTDIPAYDVVVSDIKAALLAYAIANAVTPPQKFIATEGQTEFIVTEFVPTGKGLVIAEDSPNMSNWKLVGSTYVFNVGFSAGSVIFIWK